MQDYSTFSEHIFTNVLIWVNGGWNSYSESIMRARLWLLTNPKWISIIGRERWSGGSTSLTVFCHSLSCVHALSLQTAIFHSARHLPLHPLCPPGPGSTRRCNNIHLLPNRTPTDLKWACHLDLFKFLQCRTSGAWVKTCYFASRTHQHV